ARSLSSFGMRCLAHVIDDDYSLIQVTKSVPLISARRRRGAKNGSSTSPAQMALPLAAPRTWGGARPGAGRKRAVRTRVPHRARPAHPKRFPVHLTLRARHDSPSLRGDVAFGIVRRAVARLSHEEGRTFQVAHFSVQRD